MSEPASSEEIGKRTSNNETSPSIRKHKRHKSRRHRYKHVVKLLTLAAEGQHRKVAKLLERHKSLDIDSYNAKGFTALHQAARFGHEKTVKLLLGLGADIKAEDFNGNTAAHLAAAQKEIAVLAELLKAQSSSQTGSENDAALKGLLQSALEVQAEPLENTNPRDVKQSAARYDLDSEDDWSEKLRVNAAYDDPFQSAPMDMEASAWESWDYESFVQPDIKAEDEDSYARHMWEEMQRKRSLYQQPSAATADTWGKADSTQARRQKAAKDAADNSRRILEEEQARDRAWRQAVSQGDFGAKRAAYEARWQAFVTTSGPLNYASVPWLTESEDGIRAIILYGTQSKAEERKRLRLELMRWHPDKFVARFGGRLVNEDRARVAARVNSMSQMLNLLHSEK